MNTLLRLSLYRIFIILLLCLWSLPSTAQRYHTWWKKVDKAIAQDLPRTAIEHLDAIRQLAQRKGDKPELLQASCLRIQLQARLSADTARQAVEQLETALTHEEDSVTTALYHLALATYYSRQDAWLQADTAALRLGREHLLQAIRPWHALAGAAASPYRALLLDHKATHSKYFDKDLLHIVYRQVLDLYAAQPTILPPHTLRALCDTLVQHYTFIRRPEAALLCSLWYIAAIPDTPGLDYAAQRQVRFRAYKELLPTYAHLSTGIQLYTQLCNTAPNDSIALYYAQQAIDRFGHGAEVAAVRNVQARLLMPTASIALPTAHGVLGQTYTGQIVIKNARHVTLRLRRTALSSMAFHALDNEEQALLLRHNLPQVWSQTWVLDSLSYHASLRQFTLCPKQAGVYVLTLEVGNKRVAHTFVSVSGVAAMVTDLPQHRARITVVDAASGHPLPQGRIAAWLYKEGKYHEERIYALDTLGCLFLDKDAYQGRRFVAVMPQDSCSETFTVAGVYLPSTPPRIERTYLFPDRSLYSPGDTIRYAGIQYSEYLDTAHVLADTMLLTTLYDPQYTPVSQDSLRTDAYGRFVGHYPLSHTLLPGVYTLQVGRHSTALRIEPFKTPTFTIDFITPHTVYHLGDSVQLRGIAQRLSGISLRQGQVRFRCYASPKNLWRTSQHESMTLIASGNVNIDSTGHFSLPLHLSPIGMAQAYTYLVTVEVTASNGESLTAQHTLQASQHPYIVRRTWDSILDKTHLTPIQVSLHHLDGQAIKATGYYQVHKGAQVCHTDTFSTNTPFVPSAWRTLPSGAYTLTLAIQTDTLLLDTSSIILFAQDDLRVPTQDTLFTYVSPDSTVLSIGSALPTATLYVDILTHDSLLSSRRYLLHDSLLHLPLRYEPHYGEAAVLLATLYQAGNRYTYRYSITRPRPQHHLKLQWLHFRDKTQPGSTETWRLHLSTPQGKAVAAGLLLSVYDAALDEIVPSTVDFRRSFRRSTPPYLWHSIPQYSLYMKGQIWPKILPEYPYRYATFAPFTSSLPTDLVYKVGRVKMGTRSLQNKVLRANTLALSAAEYSQDSNLASSPKSPLMLRTNFAPLAFFSGQLQTDEDGQIHCSFTLPQSITKWRIRGIGYTKDLCYVNIDTVLTASKAIEVMPQLPRYLHATDTAYLAATIINKTNQSLTGTAYLTITDTIRGRIVQADSFPFNLAAQGETRISHIYIPTPHTAGVTIQFVAQTAAYSDGERHYLPILPAGIQLTQRYPLSLSHRGTYHIALDSLRLPSPAMFEGLTLSFASSPQWYALMALPTLATRPQQDTYTLATRLYAYTQAMQLLRQHSPYAQIIQRWIRTAKDSLWYRPLEGQARHQLTPLQATPWRQQIAAQRQVIQQLANFYTTGQDSTTCDTIRQSLRAAQLANGAWPWFEGMQPSTDNTAAIAVLLARLQNATADSIVETMLQQAMRYLGSENHRLVNRMRQQSGTNHRMPLRAWQWSYLHALGLRLQREGTHDAYQEDTQLLLRYIMQAEGTLTLYENAQAAHILQLFHLPSETWPTRLLQYTTYSPSTGRLFAGPQYMQGGSSLMLHLTVMQRLALQAAQYKKPLSEMTQWLLQNKRTQDWQDLRSTTEAITLLLYASAPPDTSALPLRYTMYTDGEIIATNAPSQAHDAPHIGYIHTYYPKSMLTSIPDSIILHHSREGSAWGSMYADYIQPLKKIAPTASGMQLTRQIQVLAGTQWHDIHQGDTLHVGLRIRTVLRLQTSADYDYVTVRLPLAASVLPITQHSGYYWSQGGGYYQAIQQREIQYYADHLPRGTYVWTQEFILQQAGTYHWGIAQAACAYAPAYAARTADALIRIISQ